jgi:hypothetical protein
MAMEQEELELCECANCGADVDLQGERYFAFSSQDVLCFECAIELGGQYDEMDDLWLVAPDVAVFADERRPHA